MFSFLFVLPFIWILRTQEDLVGNSADRNPSPLESKERKTDYEYPPINNYWYNCTITIFSPFYIGRHMKEKSRNKIYVSLERLNLWLFPLLSLPPPQLLDVAGNLLERPLVAQDASDKYLVLIQMFNQDLDTVRIIYSQHVQEEAELGRLVARGFGWGVLLLRVQLIPLVFVKCPL